MGSGIALVGIALLLLALSGKGRGAKPATLPDVGPGPDVRLGKDFWLSEFLRSDVLPAIKYYSPSPAEIANLKRLVTLVLQPLRDRFGPVTITHGGRPPLTTKEGLSFAEGLIRAGYQPAKNSDHIRFAAADLVLSKPELLPLAYMALQRNPNVRQVIAYQIPGKGITRLHVAVTHPGMPRLTGSRFAFSKTAGKLKIGPMKTLS